MSHYTFLHTQIDHTYDNYTDTPTLLIFGTDRQSRPVTLRVNNFYHYIYCEPQCEITKNLLTNLETALLNFEKGKVMSIECVEKQSIYGYHSKKKTFLKISINNPNGISALKTMFENGIYILNKRILFKVYESNIPYVMRFMIDKNIAGMSYISVNKKIDVENSINASPMTQEMDFSQSSKEIKSENLFIVADESEVHGIEQVGDYLKLPRMKILSFDIECIGRNDSFPTAKTDPVIQIGNTFSFSHDNGNSVRRDIFCLKKVAPIPDANVFCFDEEKDLLMAWNRFVRAMDPDIFIGYNIKSFDIPYLLDRAACLKLNDFPILGRTLKPIKAKDSFFSSKQVGSRKTKEIEMEGRLIFDMLDVIRKDFNLRCYTLNSVSVHFLNEQKEDVPYSSMRALQEGDKETRKRIATYCLRDTHLPLRLFFKLNVLPNYTEMARVTGVPVEYLSSRGQAIKVLSQILRNAKKEDFIVPTIDIPENERGYEGGFVMDPIKGFYSSPISVLDFSSLYPSIMIVNNLCYTTLIEKKEALRVLEDKNQEIYDSSIKSSFSRMIDGEVFSQDDDTLLPEDITVTPTQNHFVKKNKRVGLLPRILIALLEERKKAKLDLAATDDPELKASLNARQLALKISANSVYGFTGAINGKLPCLEISQSVTSFGREMIVNTKNLVETKFTKKNGYSHDAKVIYGDTDSVMIDFKESDLNLVFKISKEVAEHVSSHFVKPISLEFEKVYFPYLLMNKKRYAGLIYTRPDKPDKIDTKGIETVRRDNCEMVRNVVETCLDLILYKRDIHAAQEYVKGVVQDLYLNKIDLSQLVISKALTKTEDKYQSKQAHVELAEKLRRRDEGNAPALGDRIGYVIIRGEKGKPAYERSEDPVYVLDNNLPIDTEHYIEHQLSKPIARLFEPIMDNVNSLLQGEHTRRVKTTVLATGPMNLFVKKQITCIKCHSLGKILCDSCKKHDFQKHYLEFQEQLDEKRKRYSKCWTECQRCQGSVYNEVLCVNRVCPIFFMRTKVAKEIEEDLEKYEMLKKLEW